MQVLADRAPKYRDVGGHVAALQVALHNKGYTLTIDGVFGPLTLSALNQFQKSRSLPQTNYLDPVTMEEIGIELRPTTGEDPDEGTPEWYRRMFHKLHVVEGKFNQVVWEVRLVESGLERYREVAIDLGFRGLQLATFPFVLGCIHYKEGSCDFRKVLHNGEKIIGTSHKTTLVPAGRGPFNTWQEAAIDAIQLNKSRWAKLISGSQDIGDILEAVESYNGKGYITGAGRKDVSPYIWENSNISDGYGKYVADGKYDPNVKLGATSGVAVLMKYALTKGLFHCTGIESGPLANY